MMKSLSKILLGGSLLTILVLSTSSISQAQTKTGDGTKGGGDQFCSEFHPCDPHPTPEPITVLLFGTGLVGIGALVRRRIRGEN